MTTSLAIDEDLVREAQALGHHKTKKEAVTVALKEYIQRNRQLEVLKLFGQIEYLPEHDYKAGR